MKHPDVFGSLYIMSPCCLSPRGNGGSRGAPAANAAANDEALAAVKTSADSAKLPFGLRAQLAPAAAWSPNPKNPPLYLDLPIGDQAQAVLAKWTANAPLAFIDQYLLQLKRYRAVAVSKNSIELGNVTSGHVGGPLGLYMTRLRASDTLRPCLRSRIRFGSCSSHWPAGSINSSVT